MSEHPVEQIIKTIVVSEFEYGRESYQVGAQGVTRIEACTKSGMYANIPYVRVWAGETAIAEFCQHNICGVYFEPASAQGEKP